MGRGVRGCNRKLFCPAGRSLLFFAEKAQTHHSRVEAKNKENID